VAKKSDSIYQPGEAPGTWVKKKLQRSEDFIVGGFIPGAHGVDQLVVGVRKDGELHFVDSVKNGFVPTTRRKVQEAIEKLIVADCPFVNLPEKKRPHAMDREKMRTVKWVKPKVLAEIAFNEWTPSAHLRHSKFLRLREPRDLRRRAGR
jgi:bifunctional non-homologous end joining protein LigD